MAKIITTLSADNNMDFNEICSFKTENYIGIWNHYSDAFMLMAETDTYFHASFLPHCNNLKELDDAVFKDCDEHIIEVFEESNYTFVLEH